MEENVRNKKCETRYLIKIGICFTLLLIAFFALTNTYSVVLANTETGGIVNNAGTENEFIYLSDLPVKQSKVGWGKLYLNRTDSGGKFSVKIEGGTYSFEKGIWAHATSTVVYNLTDYQGYDYFTTYMGVNTTSGNNGNGVKFYIYTSTDGTNWTLKTEQNPTAIKSSNNAVFKKIDIKGAKFIKLYAHDNGANGNDHAVYVDAKLIKETYKEPGEDLVPSITELDNKIKTEFANANLETNKEYELTLLKREFINRAGNYALRRFLSASEENEATYRWLTGDVDNLRLYVLGGAPAGGSYYNSLTQLSRLYNEYSDDFTKNELLNNKWYPEMTNGDLYKKMAITLSLTHSQTVALWMHSGPKVNQSDALRRYAIFKYLHDDGKLKASATIDRTEWFEALQVEEMRFIMNNSIDDEEILWLNAYVKTKIIEQPKKAWLTPHPHMAYVWPNYTNKLYYENDDYFNDLFKVRAETLNEDYVEDINKTGLFDLKFIIPGGKNKEKYEISITKGTINNKISKVWMNFRNKFGTGAVCGGISKSGSNIRTTHGIPATVIGQPGHAALLYYSKTADGKGYWGIDNDVSGWSLSEKGERMLLGWGNGYGYSVVYMVLAQEAINDYQNLIKAEEQVMLANIYKGDLVKQEEIYRKALEIQSINIDAWKGLINVYNASDNKKESEYYDLAEELAEKLKCFPLPMYHLTNLIKPKLTSAENIYKFTLLQTRILTEGSKLPNTSTAVLQPGVTRTEANYLLKKADKSIATFSFDGVDAGRIVLASKFDGNGVRWDYSLDGKKTWKEVSFTGDEPHKLQLTQSELDSITAENDIYIHIVGVNYNEENLFKIDITEQSNLTNLYANDLENRVVGVNLSTEWRYTEQDKWTSYSVESPDLTGNKTVQVRQGATGTKLASPASEFYTFTEDNQPETRKYITVSHLSINSYSTQSVDSKRPFYAPNAIDGNMNTLWHTDFSKDIRQQEANPFITIELDEPKYISALEFAQIKYPGKPNDPDFVKNVTIYVSEDGENWTEAGKIENCTDYNALREVTFDKSIYGKYVKLEMGKDDMFSSIAMINLFEDISKVDNTNPTASVYYSPEEPTNQYVIARLVNPNKEITITNNDGKDTYIFTENGNFKFEFEDAEGHKGSTYAEVNWIKKDAPTADVEYKLGVDKKLLIVLDNISEDVYLLDKDNKKTNYVEVENGKVTSIAYLDDSGNTYKVADIDEDGIIKSITYKNTTESVTSVKEYKTTLEDGKVTKEEYFDSEGNSITTITDAEKETLRKLQEQAISNPLEQYLEQSGDYEFRLLDKASNIAYKSVKVDYIDSDDKILVSDITYNITKTTNQNVIATINSYVINSKGEQEISTITNNSGKNTYTFTENTEFTFEYKETSDTEDADAKIEEHKAKVTWIDKTVPTAKIKYSTKTSADKVTVTLVDESEQIIITNNGSSKEYTFTENGEFTFEFEDIAGNKGTAIAKVDWMENKSEDPTKPEDPIKPDDPTDPKDPTNPDNPTKPEEPTKPEDPAKPDDSDKIMLGDIDLDGEVTVNDLAMLKLHLIDYRTLEGKPYKAADIDQDNEITINDLAQMKLALIDLIKIN